MNRDRTTILRASFLAERHASTTMKNISARHLRDQISQEASQLRPTMWIWISDLVVHSLTRNFSPTVRLAMS